MQDRHKARGIDEAAAAALGVGRRKALDEARASVRLDGGTQVAPARRVGGQRGEAHHRAKLTEQDVLEIRRRRADGEGLVSLSAAFGVGHETVRRIAQGRAWAHVGGARTLGNKRDRLDAEGVYQRWAHGESVSSISADVGYYVEGVRNVIAKAGGQARRDADMLAHYRDGWTMTAVAAEFGVCLETVSAAFQRALKNER